MTLRCGALALIVASGCDHPQLVVGRKLNDQDSLDRRNGPHIMPPTIPTPDNEAVAYVTDKVTSSDDAKKILQGRLQQIEAQLAEKEDFLAKWQREILANTSELTQTKEDLQRGQQEKQVLGDRLSTSEKDINEALEIYRQYLELENKSGNSPAAPTLEPADTAPDASSSD